MKIGKLGEEIAVNYLIENGYKIMAQNFYTGFGEIDIIAKDKDIIVFIEVKTRTSNKYGFPIDSITKNKMNHIITSSKVYINNQRIESQNIRFDVIEVYLTEGKKYCNHIRNVFF